MSLTGGEAALPLALEVEVDRGSAGYPFLLPHRRRRLPRRPARRFRRRAEHRREPGARRASPRFRRRRSTISRDGSELGVGALGRSRATRARSSRGSRPRRARRPRPQLGATASSTTRPGGRCRAASTSARRTASRTHRTATTRTSTPTSAPGTSTSAATCGWARSRYAYIDGTCQGWLPRGEVIVDVARGFEYEPLRARVRDRARPARADAAPRRWIDMNSRASAGSAATRTSTSSRRRAATSRRRGEDLNVVNLLHRSGAACSPTPRSSPAQPTRRADGETIVYATQENRQHLLGHLTLLGLKEPVMPWCSDGPGEAELGGTWRRRSRTGRTPATRRAAPWSCRTSRTRTASRPR